jgi:hypothetical protein
MSPVLAKGMLGVRERRSRDFGKEFERAVTVCVMNSLGVVAGGRT